MNIFWGLVFFVLIVKKVCDEVGILVVIVWGVDILEFVNDIIEN